MGMIERVLGCLAELVFNNSHNEVYQKERSNESYGVEIKTGVQIISILNQNHGVCPTLESEDNVDLNGGVGNIVEVGQSELGINHSFPADRAK